MSIGSQLSKLSALIKAKRREENIGLRKAADDSGVSASTLSRLERGVSEKMPDTTTLKLLSDWLGVSLSDLINEKKTTKTNKAPQPSTAEQVEVYLRADKKLSSESANALASAFKVLYDQFAVSSANSHTKGTK